MIERQAALAPAAFRQLSALHVATNRPLLDRRYNAGPSVPTREARQTVTGETFRRMAMQLPEAVEAAHMGHPDFRVNGKIFATLGPDEDWGMVKLTLGEQASFVEADPDAFQPAHGAWGRRGATIIRLRAAKKSIVWQGLIAAWRNAAPALLAQQHTNDLS